MSETCQDDAVREDLFDRNHKEQLSYGRARKSLSETSAGTAADHARSARAAAAGRAVSSEMTASATRLRRRMARHVRIEGSTGLCVLSTTIEQTAATAASAAHIRGGAACSRSVSDVTTPTAEPAPRSAAASSARERRVAVTILVHGSDPYGARHR